MAKNAIMVSNVLNKTHPYNLEALNKILSNEKTEKKPAHPESTFPKEDDNGWRLDPYRSLKREVMIISSYGSETVQDAKVVTKTRDNSTADRSLAELAREELDVIQDVFRRNKLHSLAYVCTDFPEAQLSKQYYLDRIKQFFLIQEEGGTSIKHNLHVLHICKTHRIIYSEV